MSRVDTNKFEGISVLHSQHPHAEGENRKYTKNKMVQR